MAGLKLNSSTLTALVIAAVVIFYFLVRGVFGGAAETEAAADGESLFTVVAGQVEPKEWQDTVRLRGQTQADRKVTVKAETSGAIEATPASPGAQVKEGDVLCKLRVDARRAKVAEARAQQKRAKLDFDAASKLAKEGFQSTTSLAAIRASLDLANASVEQATLDLDRINIKAPFDGVFDDRMSEVGDYLRVGDPCGVLIQQSPFLVVGGVSERDVAKISIGDVGQGTLVTGETVEGKVRFVATSADPATRTFEVELEIPNEDGKLRDGVTADVIISTTPKPAHLLPRSALTLNDEGQVGVRTVGSGDEVAFLPVTLLSDGADGVWVSGINGAPTVIFRGQDFVRAGQKVNIAPPSTLQGAVEQDLVEKTG
ncbi:MAG: efflux RND transporter periplasmic adaptor subunit [Pseudomonadota bacterium]